MKKRWSASGGWPSPARSSLPVLLLGLTASWATVAQTLETLETVAVAENVRKGEGVERVPKSSGASVPFEVAGDAILTPLTGRRGDPVRGRQIVADRRTGLCLLCHPAPIAEERFQGDLAPDLAGVGGRLTEGQLRLRVVDSRRLNPSSIMPAYFRAEGVERVARDRAGQTVLDAGQVEDVVAWLATLR